MLIPEGSWAGKAGIKTLNTEPLELNTETFSA